MSLPQCSKPDPSCPAVEPASPNIEPASPNIEPASPNIEPASPNIEPASPNIEPASPNIEPASPKQEGFSARQESLSPEENFARRLVGVKEAMEERLKTDKCPKEDRRNFIKVRPLGRGAYGKVVLVEHLKDHQIYAMKIVNKSSVESRNERIVNEKKMARACDFKFIVKLHYVYQDSIHFVFFLKHAFYGSLDVLRWTSDLKNQPTTVRWFAAQLILAVQYLHACDIMHRDIKPANMLIYEDFHLEVTDFQMARICEGYCRAFEFIGTPMYMAPEMWKMEPYGKYIDWWAVGISLYEAMYDVYPYHDDQKLLLPDGVEGVDRESPAFVFFERLLRKRPSERLRFFSGDTEKILAQEWFKDISFPEVYANKLDFRPVLNIREGWSPEADIEPDFFTKTPSGSQKDWHNSFCSRQ